MERYKVTLKGISPLLMHSDNMAFMEKVEAWRKDPANANLSIKGDDRSPAFTWLACLYHDGKVLGMPSDNVMTMLRDAGAKVVRNGLKTYKTETQSGLFLDQQQLTLLVNGQPVDVAELQALIGVNDFLEHVTKAEKHGFELLVKRAKLPKGGKHVRVRPMFRQWELTGSFTVMDPDASGLKQPVLETILRQAGSVVGLGDWRPSSGKSGTFGRFQPFLEKAA